VLDFSPAENRSDETSIVCFPICPGAVDTDASKQLAKDIPMFASVEWKDPEATATHVVKIIDEATRETDRFMQWDGTPQLW
jgi:hypothetical protein